MENIKPFALPDLAAIKSKYSPFLKEVRKKILFTFYVFVVTMFAGFIYYEKIIKFLIDLLSLRGVNIVFTSPFQFINLSISCGVATGLVAVFPFFIAQVLSFLRPALRKKEYKTAVRFLPFSIVLFLIGFTFGALIMKWQIDIFLAKSVSLGIGNMLDISRLLATVLLVSTLMGVCFQLPLVLLLLMRMGIINRQQLAKKRLWVYLGSFIFVLFLPADSILVDALLTLPLIVLFEFTLILSRIFEGKKG